MAHRFSRLRLCLPFWRRLFLLAPVLLAPALLSGCAFGGGGGLGITGDTRGSVGIMLTGHVQTWGIRAEPEKGKRHETAAVLMPAQVSGGYEFNPSAWVLRLDAPGIGVVSDSVDNSSFGLSSSLHLRALIRWEDGAEAATTALGPAIRLAWLPHLSTSQLPRLDSRPEWPDGWEFHSVGPAMDISVLTDDKGWFGSMFLGGQYQYLSYFYMGL